MGESACYAHLLDDEGRMPEPGRIRTQRVYDDADRGDEERILVDRLWPRGVRKDSLRLNAWAKELAPSDELRRWFHAHPDRWHEFESRYRKELREHPVDLQVLASVARRRPVVLLYAARDREHNQAVVLKSVLEEALKS